METNETENVSKTFSAEYVREIREEAKSYRLQMEELRKEVRTHKEAADKATAEATKATQDAESRVAEFTSQLAVSRYEADLKMEAVKAGIVDTDLLKLMVVDTNKSAADAVAEFAASKPFCFTPAVTTTVPTAAEPRRSPQIKKALEDMTPEERAADLKSYV